MKTFIRPSYTFTPGASGAGTVDLSSISGFDIKKLVAIINQTDGVVIYSTGAAATRYTSEAAGVVTLFKDTSTMSGSDVLQIIYEDLGQKTAAESSPVVIASNQTAIPTTNALGATEAKQDAEAVLIGAVNETAPVTDTASSGLNGRLQRLALLISNLASRWPAALGQALGAESFPVVPASDYVPPASAVPSAQTVKQKAIAFGTTAVRLTHDGSAPDADRRLLKFIIEPGTSGLENYFLGSSSVTSSGADRGIRLYPGTLYEFKEDPNDYYIISDTASQTFFIVEVE
jgi:hypothetical protein